MWEYNEKVREYREKVREYRERVTLESGRGSGV